MDSRAMTPAYSASVSTPLYRSTSRLAPAGQIRTSGSPGTMVPFLQSLVMKHLLLDCAAAKARMEARITTMGRSIVHASIPEAGCEGPRRDARGRDRGEEIVNRH